MKKIFLSLAVCVTVISLMAFTEMAPKPKLNASVEKFYAGQQNKADSKQVGALHDVASYITQGMSSDHKITMVFTCADNSFKSIAAQIVLQSLLSLDKTNKLATASFGNQPSNVSPQLLKVLAAYGFVVNDAATVVSGKKHTH